MQQSTSKYQVSFSNIQTRERKVDYSWYMGEKVISELISCSKYLKFI